MNRSKREIEFGIVDSFTYRQRVRKSLVSKFCLQKVFGSKSLGCLFALRLNPDATYLATATADCINIWNTKTEKISHILRDHEEIVTSFVWLNEHILHQNNKFLNNRKNHIRCRNRSLTKEQENTVELFEKRKLGDFGTEKSLNRDDYFEEFEFHEDQNSVIEENDENMFITGSLDKTIRIWKNFKRIKIMTEHRDWIRCLGVNNDSSLLVSGCVSGKILLWDLNTCQVLSQLKNHFNERQGEDLNTINSLEFQKLSPHVFVSGARDGYLRIWDARCLKSSRSSPESCCLNYLQSHDGKVNTASYTSDDLFLLSSGRDNAIRFWDTRNISSSKSSSTFATTTSTTTTSSRTSSSKFNPSRGMIREFKDHKCQGYNVAASFYNNEQNIITGSEDKGVYIYDVSSGGIDQVLGSHPSVVHLVAASDFNPLPTIYSTSIESNSIYVWTPNTSKKKNVQIKQKEENSFISTHRAALDSIMHKYGDQILKIFHQHNFTFSGSLDWPALLTNVGSDNPSADLLEMVNEMAADFSSVLQIYNPDLLREELEDEAMFEEHQNITTTTTTTTPSSTTPSTASTTSTTTTTTTTTQDSSISSTSSPQNENTNTQEQERRTEQLPSIEEMQNFLAFRQREREKKFERKQRERQNRNEE